MHLPNFEVIVIEFYQNKQTWLLLGLYKLPSQKLSGFIENLSLILDFFLIMITSHLLEILISPVIDNVPLESFLQANNLTSLIKEAKCFQSSNHGKV